MARMQKARKSVKKKEKVDIVMDAKLELALKGYVPEFANTEDIDILKSLGKLKRLLGSIDSKAFREIVQRKELKKLTSKMREIQMYEERLVYRITKRNLDF